MSVMLCRTKIIPAALFAASFFSAAAPVAHAVQAPGAPGHRHVWAPALKQAVGTAYEVSGARSPIWFTVAQGIVTEVFYPSVDHPQLADHQLLIVGPGIFWEQKRDAISDVRYSGDGFSVVIEGRDRQNRFQFRQIVVTDTERPVLRIQTRFTNLPEGAKVYSLTKPAIGNDGNLDRGEIREEGFVISNSRYIRNEPITLALLSGGGFGGRSVGYFGASDGYQQLSRTGSLNTSFESAGPGSISLTGEIRPDALGQYEVVLAFGRHSEDTLATARASLGEAFGVVQERYEMGWRGYLDSLRAEAGAAPLLNESFYRRSVQILKSHEDKRARGAMVAAMNKPGIPFREQSQSGNYGGYHLVWPRDLYHTAIGLLAAGDQKTPVDTLRFLVRMQKQDGSWWQNFWLDGTPYWQALQMDQVAFPILLVEQLKARRLIRLEDSFREMVRRAADFIRTHGPITQQERWEENGGYTPHTLAAQIAALRAATRLLGDSQYATTAQQWDAQVEAWTMVPRGTHGSDYYLRAIRSGNPSLPETIEIGNSGGEARAADIIDGGFLDLVRLGVRPFNAQPVVNTLAIYESAALGIHITTVPARAGLPAGRVFGRYNRDRYGAGNIGGFWPLLGGERGEYALLAGDRATAAAQLGAFEASALPSGTIPEQLMRSGEAGLGVPAPLAWSHAGILRLKRSLADGKIFDFPLR